MAIADAFSAFPYLETQRLILRQIVLDDVEAVFALYSEDAVAQFLDINTLTERREAVKLVEFFIERYQNGVSIRFAIALRDQPQQLIGTCGFHPFDEGNRRVEIGYDLAKAYWQRGIMTEALTAMLHYGFTILALHRIEAVTTPENYPSRRLLEKLGFQQEGILRQRSFYRGRYVDEIYFGLLREVECFSL